MASKFFLKGRQEIAAAATDLDTDATVKLLLLKDTYTPDEVAHDFVGDTGAFGTHEADCTGYADGFGGAGRHTLTARVWNRDDDNFRLEFDFTDEDWSALGGASNNDLGGVGLIKEYTNDADSVQFGYDDTNDVTTNGGTISYAPNAEGMLQM